jgi:hypothetical protein
MTAFSIAVIVVATIALAALELWLIWTLAARERPPRRRHRDRVPLSDDSSSRAPSFDRGRHPAARVRGGRRVNRST